MQLQLKLKLTLKKCLKEREMSSFNIILYGILL